MNNRKLTPGGAVAAAPAVPWYQCAPFILAYQPLGAESLAASYVNLVNPGTYNATAGSAPSFNTLTGWTFAGNRLATNYTLPQTANLSIVARIANYNSAGATHQWICGESSGLFGIRLRLNATTSFTFVNGTEYISTTTSADGVICIAGGRCFFNGTLLGTLNNTGFAGGINLEIGRLTGASAYYCYTDIMAFGINDSVWSDEQVAAISAALVTPPF